jgi:phage N-6-adenine-methyltransferase
MSDAPLTRSGPTVRRGKSKQDYGTPWEFIDAVVKRFGPLEWDLACTRSNQKTKYGYTYPEQDSLRQLWYPIVGNAWLNPPFDNIGEWAQKLAYECVDRKAFTFFLTPASIGTEWFAKYVAGKAMVLGLSPRLTFEGCDDPYPKDLMLSVYGFGFHGFDTWRWTTKDRSE